MPRQAELIRLNVAAGILVDSKTRVLVAERLGDGPFHGLWEFPGGKIHSGESAEAALKRELDEEIGIADADYQPFMELQHEYPDRHVSIAFFIVQNWSGDPVGREGQGLRWVHLEALTDVDLLPADEPVVKALREQFS